ncbi:hypothetical protein [Nonlabens dokdonensis]|nr:hypothetical protein [Nonlabens dokdonensis]
MPNKIETVLFLFIKKDLTTCESQIDSTELVDVLAFAKAVKNYTTTTT